MKWLFFILLLANLGMFILIYPQQAEKSDEKGLPDIGDLFLSKEIAELSEQANGENAPVSADTSDSQTVAAEESRSEPAASQDLETEQKQDSAPQLSSESESASMPEAPTDVQAETAESAEVTEQEHVSVELPTCKTLGYLQSRSEAEIVSVRLRALGLKPELQSETSNEQAGIWVLVPPQATRREAIEIANRLEQDGISDLWRFTSGELVHAISLGLFRNQERAEARRREISELGYEVIVKPRYRQATKYWLYFQQRTLSTPAQEEWRELLENFPQIEVQETACR
ncbi:MAG: hypothetical protein AB2598_13785 [Candidatus Thiodiazotropha sp.]